MSNRIKGVNFDEFVVYVIGRTNKPVVVKKIDAHSIEVLSREFKGIENVPDGKTVLTKDLKLDESDFTYIVKDDNLIERNVNELRCSWVNLYPLTD